MDTTTADLHVVLGSGPAGTTLAEELARRGHQVRLINRSGSGESPRGVIRLPGDVATVDGARAAIRGAAVVYHAVNVPYHRQVDLLPGIQEAILGAVQAEGARLVVLDTLYPYGETHGEVMTEDTPWRATSAKGRMRAELDARYLAAHRDGRVNVAMGRSADFVGPRVLISSLGGTVFPGALTGGEVIGMGDIDLPHSYTDIRNVAVGLATLGENPDAGGRVWHLPTAPAPTTREVFDALAKKVGQPLSITVKTEPIPFGPFDKIFMDSYAELFYQHTEPQVMDSSAIQDAFGLRPIDLDSTLDDTIDWYRTFLASQAPEPAVSAAS
jgi:nucleoside-diphosphate-sugar epimerase